MKNNPLSSILLLITAFIWGSTFVAQRAGMEYLEPFAFNTVRSLLGAFSLLIPVLIFKIKKGHNTSLTKWQERRYFIIAGIICGAALFLAIGVQQVGMVHTSASKAGFISSMYIIIVPLISIFFGKKFPRTLWLGVLLASVGLYLLCAADGLTDIGRGDILVMISAFLFALHILVIDYFAPKVDSIKLSCVQFFVCGIISFFPAILFETTLLSAIWECRWALLYAGIVSSGIAYTLQIMGQKDTNPAVASLILSLESVFAVISGVIILHETLTLKEITGCVLMFIAIIVAQGKKAEPNHISTKFPKENQ